MCCIYPCTCSRKCRITRRKQSINPRRTRLGKRKRNCLPRSKTRIGTCSIARTIARSRSNRTTRRPCSRWQGPRRTPACRRSPGGLFGSPRRSSSWICCNCKSRIFLDYRRSNIADWSQNSRQGRCLGVKLGKLQEGGEILSPWQATQLLADVTHVWQFWSQEGQVIEA